MQRMLKTTVLLTVGLVISSGCGDDVDEAVGATIATYTPIRALGKRRRVHLGESLASGGLGRLQLDSGPLLLLDSATVKVEPEQVVMESGRLYVEVAANDSLQLSVGEDRFLSTGAAWSLSQSDTLYVLRGEVAHYRANRRQVIRTGEQLDLASGEVSAVTLWEDWTGGLAKPGPGLDREAAIGRLEARVPNATGQARWPLALRRMSIKVRVEGDLAFTEVEQEFFNPASESVEGLYRIVVPTAAVLQRFAVDRNGQLVDGYVREKAQARQAYEAQVFRGSTLDPALLEWVAPGNYKARIYPIAAGETRRIAIRYAEWLERPHEGDNRVYRFAMAGAKTQIQEFSFEADLGAAEVASIDAGFGAEVDGSSVVLRRSDFLPRADFFMELSDTTDRAAGQRAWRAPHQTPRRDPSVGALPNEDERDYAYIPLVLPDSLYGEGNNELDIVVVADVSAGTDPSHLELGRSVVEALAAHLGEQDRISIVGSDVALRPLANDAELGAASVDRVDTLLNALAREPAGGATDLGAALSQAADKLDPTRNGIVIYVGDGAPTVGELGADELVERMQRLANPVRTYAIAVGSEAKLGLLDALTRGGGLALRVESRSAAAEAALDVLAHCSRRVAQRVTVEIDGADQIFPRRPTDVVAGAVLPIVARVEGDLGREVRVHGWASGQEFEQAIALTETRIADEGDLRMRWAAERLHQLLLTGAQRAEIADLGVRYGLITPFTSFYVPSAAELSSLLPFRDVLENRRSVAYAALASPLHALTSVTGCQDMVLSSEPNAHETPVEASEVLEDLVGDESEEVAPSSSTAAQAAPTTTAPVPSQPVRPEEPSPEPETVPSADPTVANMARRAPALSDDSPTSIEEFDQEEAAAEYEPPSPPDDPIDELLNTERPQRSSGQSRRARGGSGGGEDARLGLELNTTPEPVELRQGWASNADTGPDGARPTNGQERRDRQALDASLGSLSGDLNRNEVSRITTRVEVRFDVQAHRARRCSDASTQDLNERRALWRERLRAERGAYHRLRVYNEARRNCELRRWSDRRALLNLILQEAGTVQQMIEVYQGFSSSSLRNYLRRAIMRRVRSADDLRMVRRVFGAKAADDTLIAQVLERAGEAGRLDALRRLVEQLPHHVDLKLQLLEELEKAGRKRELYRYAQRLRANPLADAGIRTAIGEMFLRLDDEAEARRVFSEIVEFAPTDASARRRLGDLYRAHGWFEDAYRQYQTLASITPDDFSVLLLLAQAASGAGRIDEALRLYQRLAETAEPGAAQGIARVALLWSSVHFAELRQAARGNADQELLDSLSIRMRRSGVMGQATAFRALLVWSHPEANLSLWAAHPQMPLSRPTDIRPEYGLEAFEVEEQEPGAYRFEVRRGRAALGEANAKLVVLWNEGQESEQVQIVDVQLSGGETKLTWEVSGTSLRQVTP